LQVGLEDPGTTGPDGPALLTSGGRHGTDVAAQYRRGSFFASRDVTT